MSRTSDYLAPGYFVDSDSPEVREFAAEVVGTEADPVARAARLFAAVRDRIWYNPFLASTDPDTYRASAVLAASSSWCVPKAVLLAAAARAVGIPARLGYADVRNHLQTPRLRERMGGADLFVYHGYTDLHLDGRWLKATPAFNAELCARFGVEPIDFDGHSDALLHEHTADGGSYMEYLYDRGVHADLPFDDLVDTLRSTYGEQIFATGSDHATDEFNAPTPR